jgi:hypothetical protein
VFLDQAGAYAQKNGFRFKWKTGLINQNPKFFLSLTDLAEFTEKGMKSGMLFELKPKKEVLFSVYFECSNEQSRRARESFFY